MGRMGSISRRADLKRRPATRSARPAIAGCAGCGLQSWVQTAPAHLVRSVAEGRRCLGPAACRLPVGRNVLSRVPTACQRGGHGGVQHLGDGPRHARQHGLPRQPLHGLAATNGLAASVATHRRGATSGPRHCASGLRGCGPSSTSKASSAASRRSSTCAAPPGRRRASPSSTSRGVGTAPSGSGRKGIQCVRQCRRAVVGKA